MAAIDPINDIDSIIIVPLPVLHGERVRVRGSHLLERFLLPTRLTRSCPERVQHFCLYVSFGVRTC
jgi:hypothetical protein